MAKTAYIFSQRGNVNQRIMIKKEFLLFQENFLFTSPDKTKQDKLSFELVSCVNRLFQRVVLKHGMTETETEWETDGKRNDGMTERWHGILKHGIS